MPYKDPEKRRAYSRQYYKRHKAEMARQNRAYRKKHVEHLRERRTRWRERQRKHIQEEARRHDHKNREHRRRCARAAYHRRKARDPVAHRRKITAYHLQTKYGITLDDFDAMCCKQNNRCALCHGPMEFGGRLRPDRAVIDHDHSTGKVRGLLHSRCNMLLGAARERPALLRQAARYLRKYQKK